MDNEKSAPRLSRGVPGHHRFPANMIKLIMLSVVFGFACARHRAETGPGGSFAIWICPGGCSVSDTASAAVTGYLVLSDAPLTLGLKPLPVIGAELQSPTACFQLTQREQGTSLAGIIPVASTTWARMGDSLSVLLYGSPDATFTLTAIVKEGVLRGVGRQSGFIRQAFDDPGGDVHGVRIGRAEETRCSRQ